MLMRLAWQPVFGLQYCKRHKEFQCTQRKIMKKRLRDRLPSSARMLIRRLVVKVVGKFIHLIGDLLNIAACNGLDLRRELPWDVRTGLIKANLISSTTQDLNAQSEPTDQTAPESLSAQDFLFLMNILSGLRDTSDTVGANVRCSIIIPVFGKLNYTFQCFRSLIQEINFQENEIIIVNNGSPDETERVFAHLSGLVRLINNEDNRGFVHACNQGAAIARGEYLVFLNNDTIIKPGWLENLVETVENDSMVGAVGSMLIYPDGRLQEAGSIIWIDGCGWNYGRGKDPEERRFKYAREVDYCSGSSLLVRKNLFDRLGGFDERYAPAYYEDADLCFGVRSLGYKVMYQPLSRLIHYEGVTAGTNIQAGFKRHQELNRTRFVEKWRDVLKHEHLENDAYHVELAAERRRGPRVIVFDDGVPTPDQDSGSLRMSMILKTLAAWGQAVFVPIYESNSREYEALLEKQGIRIASLEEYKDILREGDFYAAILSRPSVADAVLPAIRKIDPGIKIIFDTVDIHFLRLEREYQLTKDIKYAEESAFLKKQETRLAASSDEVWCVTAEDKKTLQQAVPTARIKVIPNIHPLKSRGKSFDEREGLFFIGNFNHRPNTDAVHYFMHKVFPLIRSSLPGVKFYVVGSHMPEEIKWYGANDEDVITLGYQREVDSLFESARVFVAPLRYGSGMKGKIGQAFSYGLPVVTTPIGSEGMGLQHEREVMIADDRETFAQMVVQVYRQRELWQRLSCNGYRHIEECFAPQIVERNIYAALNELNYQERTPQLAVTELRSLSGETVQAS